MTRELESFTARLKAGPRYKTLSRPFLVILKLETVLQELMSTTPTQATAGDVANLALADMGRKRIDWANQSMKVLQIIRKDFIKNQPLKGIRISACLHVT